MHITAEDNVTATSLGGLEREITSMWSKVCTPEFFKQLIKQILIKLQKVVTNRGSQYVDWSFISVLPFPIEVNENAHYVSRLWNMLIKIGIQRSDFVFGTERR